MSRMLVRRREGGTWGEEGCGGEMYNIFYFADDGDKSAGEGL